MAEKAILKHVRSAQTLGSQVAAEGRHEEAWHLLKDSVTSILAATSGSPDHKMLKLAVRLAEQQKDMKTRSRIMQQAFDELLVDKPMLSSRPGSGRRDASRPGSAPRLAADASSITGVRFRPGTPTRKRPTTGLSTDSQNSSYTDPRVGPSHLRQYLKEISENPPDGRPAMYRSSSAPYVAHTPHAKEQQFSGAVTEDGRVTSHYTRFPAPKSNSHFKNTLAGASTDFDDLDQWKTSNQVFQRNAHKYNLDPAARVSRDANFQYVNGDANQGIASIGQRVRLPAYHRTQAEINGLGMGGR